MAQTERSCCGSPGLKRWFNSCDNNLFSALTFSGGAGFRKRILSDTGDTDQELTALLQTLDDTELFEIMTNLGGHCLETLLEAFQFAEATDRRTCFIACATQCPPSCVCRECAARMFSDTSRQLQVHGERLRAADGRCGSAFKTHLIMSCNGATGDYTLFCHRRPPGQPWAIPDAGADRDGPNPARHRSWGGMGQDRRPRPLAGA